MKRANKFLNACLGIYCGLLSAVLLVQSFVHSDFRLGTLALLLATASNYWFGEAGR